MSAVAFSELSGQALFDLVKIECDVNIFNQYENWNKWSDI